MTQADPQNALMNHFESCLLLLSLKFSITSPRLRAAIVLFLNQTCTLLHSIHHYRYTFPTKVKLCL